VCVEEGNAKAGVRRMAQQVPDPSESGDYHHTSHSIHSMAEEQLNRRMPLQAGVRGRRACACSAAVQQGSV